MGLATLLLLYRLLCWIRLEQFRRESIHGVLSLFSVFAQKTAHLFRFSLRIESESATEVFLGVGDALLIPRGVVFEVEDCCSVLAVEMLCRCTWGDLIGKKKDCFVFFCQCFFYGS